MELESKGNEKSQRRNSSGKVEKSQYVPVDQKLQVAPRVITGPANIQNQGAIDWGINGLLAYGCNYTVVIVDTKNVQPMQTLDKHKSMVNKILWGDELRTRLDLVSADVNGFIIIWDVTTGEPKASLHDSKSPLSSMAWLSKYEEGDHLLLTLQSPNSVILWDIYTQTKVWKKSYSENLVSFDLNPFEPNKVAFQCSDCILFVEDMSISRTPTSNGRKFYVSTSRSNINTRSGSSSNLSTSAVNEERYGPKLRFRRLMRDLVVGEAKPKADESMAMAECLQLLHHRAVRNILLLVYSTEILLLDLHINHTVGLISLERSTSPLLQVVSARQRDVLFGLHDSGSVSARFRRQQPTYMGSPLDAPAGSISSLETAGDSFLEVLYDQRCQSEVIRQTKSSKIIGISVNPICETRIALFLNTSKIVFLELQTANKPSWLLPVISPVVQHSSVRTTLSDLVPPLYSDVGALPLRLILCGLLPSLTNVITSMRMSPACIAHTAHKGPCICRPFLAVGTTTGMVQIVNVETGAVDKEIAVCSYPIRGIEWTDQLSFITWGYPNLTGVSSTVRNELCQVNCLTGHVQFIRQDKGDESPIDLVRVSLQKPFCAIVLKDGTLELWDLNAHEQIRSVSKRFTNVVELVWTGRIISYVFVGKSSSNAEKIQAVGSGDKSSIGRSDDWESFLILDAENKVLEFMCNKHVCNPSPSGEELPELSKGTLISLAQKGNRLLVGDSEGTIVHWHFVKKERSTLISNRGAIRKICFSPCKGRRALVLHNDGVFFLDMRKTLKMGPELRWPKDMVRIVDIEFAAPDRPILATQDGCLRIMDGKLSTCSSALVDYVFQDPLSCMALLPVSLTRNLQIVMATNYWKKSFEDECNSYPSASSWNSLTEDDGFTLPQLSAVKEQFSQIDNRLLSVLSQPAPGFGTADRCLILAKILGTQFDIDFWTVALYYLKIEQAKMLQRTNEAENNQFNSELESPNHDNRQINRFSHILPLDANYDVLCDSYTFRRIQMDRVALYEMKRGDYEHTKRVIQKLILLGETDRAVQMLLETDLENSNYYTDAIKACLVATIQSTGAAQSTIKLVATNLIANGNIWEGVQLLCLIGKGLDACRYLLSYGLWDSAVWLAKSVLPSNEAQEVLRKWTDHLFSMGQRQLALLVTVSMADFERTLECLGIYRMHMHAGLLLQACREYGVLPRYHLLDTTSLPASKIARLIAVELDFARSLFDAGNHRAAMAVCMRLGDNGTKLMREFDILAEEEIL